MKQSGDDILMELRFEFGAADEPDAVWVSREYRRRTTDGIWGVWRRIGPKRLWHTANNVGFEFKLDRDFVKRINMGRIRE